MDFISSVLATLHYCSNRNGLMIITGTSHGTTYSYDTHVPLLWYGWDIKPGYTSEPVDITDIAPTIASFLNIMSPNTSIGKPILSITK